MGQDMTQDAASQREVISEAVNSRTWAIVGASEDTSKFGNRIYRDLKRAGYEVYGVNPNAQSVDGDPVWSTLAELPVRPDVVNVVVPSWVGRGIANDAADLGIRIFWLQPGAESAELVEHARGLGLKVIFHACSMVEKRTWTQ
jgi:uncharacterized protein